ncbi:MAG TPA: anti-sigma factor [Terracidiphilus sp.]|nr:anti-sigma factor [Terracidiphilus sp.]
MTAPRHISPEDLALHAMQALSPEESAAVRSHLAECTQCRDELASITGDLALVALTAEQEPLPAGARDRFIARLPVAVVSAAKSESSQVVSIATKRPNSASVWIPWLAVAALLVLSASLGFKVQRLQANLQSASEASAQQIAATARARQVLDVLSAPAAQHVLLTAAKTAPQPSGRAVYLADKGSLIFQGNNLAQLPEGKTYELWVIPANGSAPIPAGLFRPDATGNASVVLPSLPLGVPAKAFGVTIENAGGSTTPTAPIILAGAPPASGE